MASPRPAPLAALIILLSALPAWPAAVPFTFLHFNDLYLLRPKDPGDLGDIARLKTLIRQARERDPSSDLIFPGDFLSPSKVSRVYKGSQMVDLFNLLGITLALKGNHDFDYGVRLLRRRLRQATFPFLAGNILEENGTPFAGLPRTVIREKNGVKVGYFGVLTDETTTMSSTGKLRFEDPMASAARDVADLRARGAQLIVGLTHLRVDEDRELALRVPGIHLIIGAHDHSAGHHFVNGTHIVKAGSDGRYLGEARLDFDPQAGALSNWQWFLHEVAPSVPRNETIAALIEHFELEATQALEQPISFLNDTLDTRRCVTCTGEAAAGNWLTDIMRDALKADVALSNAGQIRSEQVYRPGPFTHGDLLSIFPWSTMVTLLRMPGAVLRRMLEHGLSHLGENNTRLLHPSGLRYEYDPARPEGNRLLSATVGDQPLDDNRQYTVAAPTFLVNGGDGYDLTGATRLLIPSEEVEIVSHIHGVIEGDVIRPALDGRLRCVEALR